MTIDQRDKGDHAELRVAAKLKRFGWNVLLPYDEDCPFDVVAERSGEFVRIQVKSSVFNGTSIRFNCYNSSNKSRNNRTVYSDEEIDGFGVYSEHTGDCYWVPIEESTRSSMNLNVTSEDPKRPASEYVFEKHFA